MDLPPADSCLTDLAVDLLSVGLVCLLPCQPSALLVDRSGSTRGSASGSAERLAVALAIASDRGSPADLRWAASQSYKSYSLGNNAWSGNAVLEPKWSRNC